LKSKSTTRLDPQREARTAELVGSPPARRPWPWLALGFSVCLAQGIFSTRAADPPPAARALTLLEAARTTLAHDPLIQLQEKEVKLGRGRVQAEAGKFDPKLSSTLGHEVDNAPGGRSTALNAGGFQRLSVDRTTLRVGVDKLLRSGVELSPGVEITRVDESLSEFGPDNRAEVNFTVRVPLAKGRGRRDTAAEETAANALYEAVRLELRHLVAYRLLNTALAYWDFVAASKRLEILGRSEENARELLAKTEALVVAKEVPSVETNQLVANLADKTASRIAGEQTLFEARQSLGLAMGLAFEQFTNLPPPADAFPAVEETVVRGEWSAGALIQQARARRFDLDALRWRKEAAKTMMDAAEHRLKPQVDLILQLGYAGAAGGGQPYRMLASMADHVNGLNGFAGLSFEWSPANNAARGNLTQQEALFQQTLIRATDLERNIGAGVSGALEQLRNAARELERTWAAIQEYQTAVQNEKIKRQLGLSTFLDVLVLEDRLTGAALAYLSAHAKYAAAVARLRYETGLLVTGDGRGESLRLEQFITVPKAAGPPAAKP
jgi:outer membrane protein TolC